MCGGRAGFVVLLLGVAYVHGEEVGRRAAGTLTGSLMLGGGFAGAASNTAGNDEEEDDTLDLGELSGDSSKDAKIKELTTRNKELTTRNKELTSKVEYLKKGSSSEMSKSLSEDGHTVVHELGAVSNEGVTQNDDLGEGAASTVTWKAKASTYCSGNWRSDWAARTQMPLQECKARCRASSSCRRITVGTYHGVANNCVLCTTSTEASAPWTTTYTPVKSTEAAVKKATAATKAATKAATTAASRKATSGVKKSTGGTRSEITPRMDAIKPNFDAMSKFALNGAFNAAKAPKSCDECITKTIVTNVQSAHRGESDGPNPMLTMRGFRGKSSVDQYCHGKADFFILKTYNRPFVVSPASLRLTPVDLCLLRFLTPNGVKHLKKYSCARFQGKHVLGAAFLAKKRLEKLNINVAKAIAEMNSGKPKGFFGMKLMCCSKIKCITKKLCTHADSDACVGL